MPFDPSTVRFTGECNRKWGYKRYRDLAMCFSLTGVTVSLLAHWPAEVLLPERNLFLFRKDFPEVELCTRQFRFLRFLFFPFGFFSRQLNCVVATSYRILHLLPGSLETSSVGRAFHGLPEIASDASSQGG
ncbi:hypothetical protein NPIL_275511 [Nephila pilipes]|uniref:Uncharacterized protein n=1 Tax=Nephila pilipes TaxID=299642 RepID=A0A8X6Q8F6_NEPPI|nr:hypothetical protein NPIL_275511 [Nephila pilipes]